MPSNVVLFRDQGRASTLLMGVLGILAGYHKSICSYTVTDSLYKGFLAVYWLYFRNAIILSSIEYRRWADASVHWRPAHIFNGSAPPRNFHNWAIQPVNSQEAFPQYNTAYHEVMSNNLVFARTKHVILYYEIL